MMVTQPTLFQPSSEAGTLRANPVLREPVKIEAPHNGTETSKLAAARQTHDGKADRDRTRIATWMYQHPEGATREQLADALGIPENTLRPRAFELLGKSESYVRRGGVVCLVETDERRPTRTGSPAAVIKHKRFVKGGAS